MALVLFAFSLALNTRHNDFPYSYHPDEGGKTGQIIERSRNYHHPLLLLSVTDIVSRVAFIPRERQPIVETGRWVSAAFAAGTVAVLALLAWWYYGAIAGWATGLAVALQPDVFETAHYMKEDPALLFGLALSLLAAALWWSRPGWRTLRFLGIACGVAVSGKYLGIEALAFALPMILWHRAADASFTRGARLQHFLLSFALTFLVCNLPLFAILDSSHLSSPFRSIGHEVEGVAGGHRGITRQIPHAVYVNSLWEDMPHIILALAAVYGLYLVATARRRSPPEWILFLFPLGYLAVISCSPKIADRYLLPVNALLPFVAVLGAAEIGRTFAIGKQPFLRYAGHAALLGLAGWALILEWPAFRRAYDGYRHDDPKAVAEWITANVPADAVIVEDHRVNLSPTKTEKRKKSASNPARSASADHPESDTHQSPPDGQPNATTPSQPIARAGLDFDPSPDARVPQKVYSPNFASELGTFEQLRKNGISYVAICKQSYGRYFRDENKPNETVKKGFDRQRDFYADVLEKGTLVKDWPPGKISYLQPGIKLFRIAPAPVDSPQEK